MRFVRETGLNRLARLASTALLSIVLALVQRPTSSAEPDYHPEFNLARGWITSATFSRDGKRLLTGSFGNLTQTWDVKTGQELRRFQGHLAEVHHAVFSPDGKQVLTVAGRIDAYLTTGFPTGFPNDFTARLWDVATGKEIRCFKGHTRYVHTGSFSPDGKRILTVSADSTARLWDAGTGKQLFVFLNVNAGQDAAVFDPDGGKILGRLAGDGKIQLWDAKTGKQLCVIERDKSFFFRSAEFSPNGKLVLTACNDGTGRTWDAQTGQQVRVFKDQIKNYVIYAPNATFSADGRKVVTAPADGTARLWDTDTGNEIRKFKHLGLIQHVILNSDGKRLLTKWNKTKWNKLKTRKSLDTSMTFASLWDAETGREIKRVILSARHGHKQPIFSPDGKKVFLVTRKHATLLDATTGEMIREYK